MRLGLLLFALTGVNVYVFFFRDDTAVRKVLQPSSMGKVLIAEKNRLTAEPMTALAGESAKRNGPANAKTAAGQGQVAALTPDDGRVVEGRIGPADALVNVLAREGISPGTAGSIINALARVLDPKQIRPGDAYSVTFDAEGSPKGFEYTPSLVVRFVATSNEAGLWQAAKEEKPLDVRVGQSAGSIDSSLYESIHKAGESGALVSLLVDLFAWDIDFYTDTHPGDHWKVVVEKQYLGGQFYKYGKILAAEYGGRVGVFRAFHFSADNGQGHYYDEKGQAITKTMLKSPLRFVRVSSRFNRKRFHPVLHRVRAHLGVDYAAPVGTPVWASAGGRVVEAAMKRGSGNTVVIAHAGGLATRYYHMSRFSRGLTAGKQVKQKEVIGYVGSTGLSTGPHLHFSVTKNGAFIDPGKLRLAREAPVANRTAYFEAIKPRLSALETMTPVLAAQATAPRTGETKAQPQR